MRHRSAARRTLALCCAALLLLTAAGCVGTARTHDQYVEKAANTAEAARSAVETARLLVDATARGNSTGPYASRTLDDVEGSLASVTGQFGSVQPPGRDGDRLRTRLLALLQQCESVLAELRITARRGQLDRLAALAAPLPRLSERLARYEGLTVT
jgi:hypothetical protein